MKTTLLKCLGTLAVLLIALRVRLVLQISALCSAKYFMIPSTRVRPRENHQVLPSATRNPFEKGFLDFLKLLTI